MYTKVLKQLDMKTAIICYMNPISGLCYSCHTDCKNLIDNKDDLETDKVNYLLIGKCPASLQNL